MLRSISSSSMKTHLFLVAAMISTALTAAELPTGQKTPERAQASDESPRPELIARYAGLYSKAKDSTEKRAICLEILDKRILRYGSHIDDVSKLFGKDFEP